MDTKKWYESRTIVFVLVGLIAKLVTFIGIEVTEGELNSITDSLMILLPALFALVADLGAIWGRVRAEKAIK